MDRLLAHGVYWIFAEPRLVTYIQAGRRALWPGPDASLPRPRGVHEMEKARKEAEKRILRTIPGRELEIVFVFVLNYADIVYLDTNIWSDLSQYVCVF